MASDRKGLAVGRRRHNDLPQPIGPSPGAGRLQLFNNTRPARRSVC